ncbi:hypothetical protein HZS_1246 [Henneguya salminicola]|nr:hypothetical protein HZS_1246 [Henneguya salminicola]
MARKTFLKNIEQIASRWINQTYNNGRRITGPFCYLTWLNKNKFKRVVEMTNLGYLWSKKRLCQIGKNNGLFIKLFYHSNLSFT